MAYVKTNWVNDSAPAINAANLNKIEQGIYDNSNDIGELQESFSHVGTIVDGYLAAAKNAANNTWISICSVTLDPGVWLITCGVRWPSNATGRRQLNVSTTEADNTTNLTATPINGTVTQVRMAMVLNLQAPATYYLNAVHNAGTTLSMPAGAPESINFMRATRIK